MIPNFQKALDFTLDEECEFAHGHDGDMNYVVDEDAPGDSGGLTKFGIDQKDHPHIDIANLTLPEATQIYHDEEWTKCRCDVLPDGYDIAVFDTAVNNGMGESAKLLQRSANAVNEAQILRWMVFHRAWKATIAAALSAGTSGLRRFLLLRHQLYIDIVTMHPSDKQFLPDWLGRDARLAALLNINMNAIA